MLTAEREKEIREMHMTDGQYVSYLNPVTVQYYHAVDELLAEIDQLREKLAVATDAICRLLDIEDSEDAWGDTQFAKEALVKIHN